MASYQVLARKWRPKNFSSIVGQGHIVRALTHALDAQRLHHAYLFTGTRGVGKTTLSRIFAKALNCEQGVSAHPCGQCAACQEIDEGRFVDYIEMDAASHRGVDDMIALLERAIYAPVNARFKVYMIDEVHMLTQHAFNAMLKTLEEPPAHVKFILATTDPQKIPVTVLSRCLQFSLKQMPQTSIVEHLGEILNQESMTFSISALHMIAQAAKGSMRDALSITDQAIAYSSGELSVEAVSQMLGVVDKSYLFEILHAVQEQRAEDLFRIAQQLQMNSFSFAAALADLASVLHRIAWVQQAMRLEEWLDADQLQVFAQAFSPEQVQLYYQIVTVGRSELGLAPDEFSGFTMTLLRLLAFRPVSVTSSEGKAIVQTAAPTVSTAMDSTLNAQAPQDVDQTRHNAIQDHLPAQTILQQSSVKKPASAALQLLKDKIPAFKKTTLNPNQQSDVQQHTPQKALPQRTVSSAANVSNAVVDWAAKKIQLHTLGFDGDWPRLALSLPLKGVARELALHSELLVVNEDSIQLSVQVATYLDAAHTTKVEEALQTVLSKKVRVNVQLGEACYTAVALTKKAQEKAQQAAQDNVENDPFVLQLIAHFDAKIVEGSVRPVRQTDKTIASL